MNDKELAELDLAVARVEGLRQDCHSEYARYRRDIAFCEMAKTKVCQWCCQPTRDGAEAMRLMEKYRLNVGISNLGWYAWRPADNRDTPASPTPAVAICRAVVALAQEGK